MITKLATSVIAQDNPISARRSATAIRNALVCALIAIGVVTRADATDVAHAAAAAHVRDADRRLPDAAALLDIDKRFFSALERGDLATIKALYSPDTRVWHNFDQLEYDGGEHLRLLETFFFVHYHDRRYVDVRLDLLPDGIVRQHTLVAKLADGTPVKMLIVIFCRVRDGHITRVDEYITDVKP